MDYPAMAPQPTSATEGLRSRLCICAVLVTLFTAALLLLCASPARAQAQSAEADTGTAHTIAIAYDNSGSMVTNSTKWCGAKYSLEVLAAMLNEGDTLALYTMESTGQKLSLSGATSIEERVKAVHNADLGISDWTEPRAAEEAYSYLSKAAGDEKYLIITTDGAFNKGNKLADVEKVVSQCAADGIQVIYLAIGGDAEVIDSNTDQGVYVKLAASDTILQTMTEVANQVFGRDALPSSAIDVSQGRLSLEVPMSQIIVFAQGEDVHVGNLTSAEGETISGQIAQVKYSDRPSANKDYDPFELDKKLQGVVCTFAGDMPKGDYSLDIGGASSVEVYYKPYVDIAVGLSANNGVSYTLAPGEENEISAGTYNVSYSFLDPFTGEALESDLLYPATFNMKLEFEGSVQSVGEGEQLSVSKGQATLIANARTTGGVRVSQSYEGVNVTPALSLLDIDASAIPGNLPIDALAGSSYQVKVTKQDGSEFTAEEWEALEFIVSDEAGVPWTAEKGTEPGTVTVSPQCIDGDQWATQKSLCGTVGTSAATSTLSLSAQLENDQNAYRGSAERSVSYQPSILATLAHTWPFLLGILLVAFLLFKYITKPRLPKNLKPYVVVGGEAVALAYTRKRIKNRYSPFGPETVEFNAHSTASAVDARNLSLSKRYALGRIGLVASKKKDGKRRFVFDKQTLASMQALQDNPKGFPDPDFSPRPAKSFKDQRSRTVGMTLSFTGWNIPAPRRPRQEEPYQICFRKP